MNESCELKFKVIILGDSECGKTSIMHYLRKREFFESQSKTHGVEQIHHRFTVQDQVVEANIWDTCGQERFFSLSKMYYTNAIGALLVFDITDRESFQRIDKFLAALRAQELTETKAVLVGNKVDLASSREVSTLEAESFANSKHLQYFETSAKTGANIEAAFMEIVLFVVEQAKQHPDFAQSIRQRSTTSFRPSKEISAEKGRKKCRC